MADNNPMGNFTCEVKLQRVAPIDFVREEKDGVTYVSAKDYELAYETTLEFDDGGLLKIRAKVSGYGDNMMVLRNASGEPAQMRGWVRGSVQILNEQEQTIFRGTYSDVNVVHTLAGDEELTATGSQLEHWQSCFGEGQHLGHFFSMRVDMTRQEGALVGKGKGTID